ncbi:MAG: NAD(P)-binding domain-containing protein [Rhodovibrionaceae bacterium]|nr:NAD(P)-binding domain-containing protein [Rhodovibrionaceae bacterium]
MANVSEIHRVAIVGAGVAGLATARVLLAEGFDCTVFERSAKVGGVWTIGYSNFGVQVQRELYEFPDWPLPPDAPDFLPGPQTQAYLEAYAEHFGVMPHIRFEAAVTEISERDGPGSSWIVAWEEGGEPNSAEFDFVVVCIGLYSNTPRMPDFPGSDAFAGDIMHVSGLRSRRQLSGKRVCVLGYGKSATDAALEAAEAAAETHIVVREPHWPFPSRLAGILPFKWGLLHRLASTLIPPYQRATGVEKLVHTLGRPSVWLYWRLVELLLFFQCRLGSRFGTRVDLVPEQPVEIGGFSEASMLPRPAFYRQLRRGVIQGHRGTIAEYTAGGVRLSDGRQLAVNTVILATGWDTDFSMLEDSVWQRLEPGEDGFYLYRHMLHPAVPGLAFIGRASTVCSILTYSLQARWLAELLKGAHSLPDADVMRHDIEQMRSWKRSWMPPSGARSARLIIHMQHYHDELVKDLGVSPLRKRGVFAPLKELIFPYEPADYGSIVAGDG